MSDFAVPAGPPPPKVPEGWKAVFNDQYKEWFYVNLHTKQSTWEKPTEPAAPPPGNDAPGAPPPSYSAGANESRSTDVKKPLESNNPYNGSDQPAAGESDEQFAQRLQQEEQQRNRGTSDSYYQSSSTPQPGGIQGGYPGGPSPGPMSPQATAGKRGFLGKLLGKSSSNQGPQYGGGYPAQGGYPQQQQQYGGYPQQQYGGYPPQQQYGGYPPQGYGGYPQQYGPPMGAYGAPYGGGYGRPMPGRRPGGGGMGAGGAAALGVGGGLLGGALLANAINDGQQDAYQDGYQDGADDGGGDFDGGGGDF